MVLLVGILTTSNRGMTIPFDRTKKTRIDRGTYDQNLDLAKKISFNRPDSKH